MYHLRGLSWLFRIGKAIPITSRSEDPVLLESAYAQALAVLKEGDILGVFPEGKITADGQLNAFKPGLLKVLAIAGVQGIHPPVVPMALQGLWGSFFSRVEQDGAMTRPFRRGIFNPVTLNIGAPLDAKTLTVEQLQASIEALKEGKQ